MEAEKERLNNSSEGMIQKISFLKATVDFYESSKKHFLDDWFFRILVDLTSIFVGSQLLGLIYLYLCNDELTRIAFGGATIIAIACALSRATFARCAPKQLGLFNRATECGSVGGLAYYTVGNMSLSLLGAMIGWGMRDLFGSAEISLDQVLATTAFGNTFTFVPLAIAFHLILKALEWSKAKDNTADAQLSTNTAYRAV